MDIVVIISLATPLIFYQVGQNKTQHESNLKQELKLYELEAELKVLESKLAILSEVTEIRLDSVIKNTELIVNRLQ